MLMNLIRKMCSESTLLKPLPYFPLTNELMLHALATALQVIEQEQLMSVVYSIW